MNIDKLEFTNWMERLMQRFDVLTEFIRDIKEERTKIDGEELVDTADVLPILKVSSRSLQRYRSTGKLPYYTVSGKVYYKLSDVKQLIRESLNTPAIRNKDNR